VREPYGNPSWNPRLIFPDGSMLGRRSKLAWGPLAAELGQSVQEWRDFMGQEHKTLLGGYI
jgi:hypothetical protein